LLTLKLCSLSLSLPWFLLNIEGKERGDLDLNFHQSISPLCKGNLLDLDLKVLCGFPPCSSSHISP
jgi:hypothetical protein